MVNDNLTLACARCGKNVVPKLNYQEASNGATHLRADCGHCGSFIKFLRQTFADGVPTAWKRAIDG